MRSRSHAFTLVEALLATSLISLGVTLCWDAWVASSRQQARMEREADALTELVGALEALSLDTSAARRASLSADARTLSLHCPGGEIRWSQTPAGLERAVPNRAPRRFTTLKATGLEVREGGRKPVVLLRLRGPGDGEDVVVARALPEAGK